MPFQLSKSTCTTLVASFAGGAFAIGHSLYVCAGRLDILMLINGILGALVGVTGKNIIGGRGVERFRESQLISSDDLKFNEKYIFKGPYTHLEIYDNL